MISTLPDYATILLEGYRERVVPALLRSEFEDGYVRQDAPISRRRVERDVRIRLCGLEALQQFKCWLRDDLRNGAAWWTMYDPVEQKDVRCRFVGGDLTFTTPRQVFASGVGIWFAEGVIESWY
jgi:hypothetical protein